MKAYPKLDELLNSYLDGELPESRRTEVERLVAMDRSVEGRLLQLDRCRMLVGSLPRREAPADLAFQVREVLERRSLLGEREEATEPAVSFRYLLVRRMAGVAAILVLAGVLSAMIYTIVVPPSPVTEPVAVDTPTLNPVQTTTPKGRFCGRLELDCAPAQRMETYVGIIHRSLESQGLSWAVVDQDSSGRKVFRVRSSPTAIAALAADLGSIWHIFDSATLYVETGQVGRPVQVQAVTAGQFVRLVTQEDAGVLGRMAREMAVRNSIGDLMPARQVQVALGTGAQDKAPWPSVARPVLTSSDKPQTPEAHSVSSDRQVDLTIILIPGR